MIHLTPTENSWYPGERLSKKRSINTLLIAFPTIFIMVGGLALGIFYLFQVRYVRSSRPIRQDITKSIVGTSMFLLDEKQLSDYIARKDPTVKRVTLRKEFPQTVILNIIEDTPVAQLSNGKTHILIDSAGKIIGLSAEKDTTLPGMTYFQRLRTFETKPGITLSQPEILKAIEVVKVKNQLPGRLRLIAIPEPNRIVLTFVDMPLTVSLSAKKDIAKNVFILHNIIKGLNRKGVRPSVINLEFDKPVITV